MWIGFRPERLLTVQISLPAPIPRTAARSQSNTRCSIACVPSPVWPVPALPAFSPSPIRTAVWASSSTAFRPIRGSLAAPTGGSSLRVTSRPVRIPLARGRLLAETDRQGAPLAMLVNENRGAPLLARPRPHRFPRAPRHHATLDQSRRSSRRRQAIGAWKKVLARKPTCLRIRRPCG